MTSAPSLSHRILCAVATRSLLMSAAVCAFSGQLGIAQSSPADAPVAITEAHACVSASVSGDSFSTALGQCSAPAADAVSTDHFEADLRHGSFLAHQTDLVPHDFSSVPLVRAYGSGSSLTQVGDGLGQRVDFGLKTRRIFDGMAVETRPAGTSGGKKLLEVRSVRGSSIWLACDRRSRIWEADDDHAGTARYFYNSDGMLAYAFNTSGAIRHYTYDGTLMTTVEDEHRRVLVRNAYTSGHLTSQTFANGDVYSYAYLWQPDNSLARSVTVTLPDHSRKLISFDSAESSPIGTE